MAVAADGYNLAGLDDFLQNFGYDSLPRLEWVVSFLIVALDQIKMPQYAVVFVAGDDIQNFLIIAVGVFFLDFPVLEVIDGMGLHPAHKKTSSKPIKVA